MTRPRSTPPCAALAVAAIGVIAGCAASPGQPSTALTPNKPADYYVAQALKYFDTFDTSADPASVPDYSQRSARWEWPPWLLLTGYGKDNMVETAALSLKTTPSTVPVRDCRFFTKQPFARCTISFEYQATDTEKGGACPIYEEFTFADTGEVTFVEAWSDRAGLLPTTDAADRWAEGAGVHRMSTKIPGLGDPGGLVDLEAPWMKAAAERDADVADFTTRASDFWSWWLDAYRNAPKDFFARGCGW